MLQAHYRDYGQMTYARSLLVIHNIAHQGRGPMAELAPFEVPPSYKELFRLDDPIGGEHMNIMKAGIITAHRVVAVSHGCALTHLCLLGCFRLWHAEESRSEAVTSGLRSDPLVHGFAGFQLVPATQSLLGFCLLSRS